MADGDTTTIDPNTGQPTGWMNDLTQAFSNPLVQGLMGLSAGFGQAAMPTRMRLPFGAVLGMGMGGFGQGIGNAYKMQLEQQQAQQAQLNNQLAQAQMPAKIAQANIQRAALAPYLQNPDLLRQLTTPGGWGTGTPNMAPQLPGQQPAAVPSGQTPSLTDSGAGAVGKPGELPPPPKLATVAAPGGAKLQVADQYAPQFQGLVNDLEAAGYKLDPATSGGYNRRYIAGTTIPSEHAFGRAIDVNWTQNPQGGSTPPTIPPDLAHQLAARYGMTWGGDWSGKNYDPMHFQIAQPQSYQVAQNDGTVAPSGGPPAAPPQGGPVAPSGGAPGIPTPAQALQQAADLNRHAQIGDITGTPLFGDPAMLRSQAQILMKYGLAPTQANLEELARQQAQYQYAGPKAGAEAAAKANVELQTSGPIAAAKANAELGPKLAATGFQFGPNGLIPIPGGPADPAYVGQKKAAEEAQSITTDRQGNIYKGGSFIGRGPQMVSGWNPNTGMMEHTFTTGVGVGQSTGEAGGGGGSTGIPSAPPPLQEHFMTERGKDIAEQYNKVDADAADAKGSNYLFSNLRNDSQSWDMGRFADWKADAKAYLSALGHQFGASDESLKNLDQSLGDYQTFIKSAGTLLRAAVHETSSRAAAQEYTMIGQTMPTPTTSQQAFGQISDQWQALNDYKLAHQQFAQKYSGSAHPEQMNVDWNANVSPTAFLLNRMQQTPQGQADAKAMFARMAQTPEGKQQMIRMQQEFRYARDAGLFKVVP